MSKTTATIEIGSSKVTCTIASSSSRLSVLGFGVCGYDGYEYDMSAKRYTLPDEEKLRVAISRAISMAEKESGADVRSVTVACPAPFIKIDKIRSSIKILKSRKVVAGDMQQLRDTACRNVVPDGYVLIHCTPFKFFIDSEPSLELPVGQVVSRHLEARVANVLLNKEFAQICERCMNELNIKLETFISATHATALYLIETSDALRSAVLIDIGNSHTDLAHMKENCLQKCESIPIGTHILASDVSFCMGIAQSSSEKLVKNLDLNADYTDKSEMIRLSGGGEDYISVSECQEIVSARLEELCKYIGMYIDHWQIDTARTVFYLTGGGAMIAGIDNYLSDYFSVKVFSEFPDLNVSDNIDDGLGINKQSHVSAFAAAAATVNPYWEGQDPEDDVEFDDEPDKKVGFFSWLFGKDK